MFGRRRRCSGKGFSSFLSTVFLAVIVIAMTQIYPRMKRNEAYTADLNQARTKFSAQQWGDAIDAYGKLWQKYPDKERGDDVFNVASAHENWGVELYTVSLKTKRDWEKPAKQFESSAEIRALSDDNLVALGDCYFEMGKYAKCQEVLRTAEKRGAEVAQRFGVLRKRLEKAEEKKATP